MKGVTFVKLTAAGQYSVNVVCTRDWGETLLYQIGRSTTDSQKLHRYIFISQKWNIS